MIRLIINYFQIVGAFTWSIAPYMRKNQVYRTPTQLRCICIDCARVTNCKAYHFVEMKHQQPHMNRNPTFEPRDGSPTIHVNIRTHRTNDTEREINRMWIEHTDETKRAEERARAEGRDPSSTPLYGDNIYNISPVTTYEYDVVQCDDYAHDKGW